MNISDKYNQSFLLGLLGLLLIVMILCNQRKKTVPELFGIAGLNQDSNKHQNVNRKNHTILFFHADWCGHCQSFKPEWGKFEQWCDNNNVKYKSVEGDKHPELSQKYKIEGYPTVIKVDSSGELVEEFTGPRSLPGLENFANK